MAPSRYLRSIRVSGFSIKPRTIVSVACGKKIRGLNQICPQVGRISSQIGAPGINLVSRNFSASDVERDLVNKIKKEIEYEEEASKSSEEVDDVNQFLSNNNWEIETQDDSTIVKMTRNFGNEKVTIILNSNQVGGPRSDLMNDNMEEPDNDLGEEDVYDDEEDFDALAVGFDAVIKKLSGGNSGVLKFRASADGESIRINSLEYHSDEESAMSSTPRKDQYFGPNYHSLDEDLKANIQDYLEQRGFNDALSKFLMSYLTSMETKSYIGWLRKIKNYFS